jgi:hypothetical protein
LPFCVDTLGSSGTTFQNNGRTLTTSRGILVNSTGSRPFVSNGGIIKSQRRIRLGDPADLGAKQVRFFALKRLDCAGQLGADGAEGVLNLSTHACHRHNGYETDQACNKCVFDKALPGFVPQQANSNTCKVLHCDVLLI